MKSFALHIQQSSEIVFLTLFTHFNNSHHNPCSTPTTTYCTCPLQVVCPTSSTSLTGSTGSTARSAPHTLVALLLLSQPSAFLSTHLARSTWSQKDPEGPRRTQKDPEGPRTAQPLQSLFPLWLAVTLVATLTLPLIVMLDGHTGWSSRSLIANLVVTLTLWSSYLSLLWLSSTLACPRTRSSSRSLFGPPTCRHSGLPLLWLVVMPAERHSGRHAEGHSGLSSH